MIASALQALCHYSELASSINVFKKLLIGVGDREIGGTFGKICKSQSESDRNSPTVMDLLCIQVMAAPSPKCYLPVRSRCAD